MSGLRLVRAFLGLALLGGGAAAATKGVDIGLVQPEAGRALIGTSDVVIRVLRGEAARIQVYLDGRRVGERLEPPWHFSVEFGDGQKERLLRAVAMGTDGSTNAVELRIPALHVDDVVEVPLVQLFVNASLDGSNVGDLDRESFAVLDAGRPQAVVTFERGDVPLTALLLLDSSRSMRGAPLDAALAGARDFARSMAPLDEAKFLVVSDEVIRETGFEGPDFDFESPLGGAFARGGTALHDYLYLALKDLETRQGRRVVIVLSDGVDVDSLLSTADLEPIVARSSAIVHWIRLGTDEDARHRSVWRDTSEHAAEIAGLRRLVELSGGGIYELHRVEDAPEVFRSVLDDLRAQYVLGFHPGSRKQDGSWHDVEVSVDRKGVALRTRAGYFDE